MTARRPAQESRTVHAGGGPPVPAHARALPTGTPEGRTGHLDGDLRDAGRRVRAAVDVEGGTGSARRANAR
ncbi:hypothetical protein [Streptomyces altiplanensis]